MPKQPKLSDTDLLKLTHVLILDADSFLDEGIRHQRAKALRYFRGENPDNMPLPDGRSRMVDTQLRDTILWIMPDLTRIFAGDDKIVSIEPHGDEDTFDAEMAEEWVNYVIMRQNRGFLTTHNWIMDALLSKVGFLKQRWKESVTRKRADFEGLDKVEFNALKRAEDYEMTDDREREAVQIALPTGEQAWISEADLEPGMIPVIDQDGDHVTQTLYDVAGYQVFREWVIKEETCPPEEIGFLSETTEIPWECSFIYHESEKSLGELREMFPEVTIDDDIQGWTISETGLFDEETIERFYDTSQTIGLDDNGDDYVIDPSRRRVWLYEIYVKADRDGDGIPEWLQVFRVGDQILSIDEVEYPKIFAICPIIWPHRAVGFSLADLLFDLQDLQTALNRQILDHIYQANNPRTEIDMSGASEDTIDDYLDNRIGGYVRVDRAGTVRPLEYSPLEPWTFNLLEHWEQKRESRTGVSRLNGGLDPNSLNKTATGVVEILNQAARRIEQIARIFAETGFRDRVRGILDLSAEFPDYVRGQIMRLSGEQRELDPEAITGRYDLIVNAGIGTGNKGQQAQTMMNLLTIHQQLIQAGLGPGAGERQLTSVKTIYNTIRDMIINQGHRNTSDYIIDPSDKNAERDPESQPKPTKDELDHQVEMEKIKLEREKQQAEAKQKQAELELEARKLALEERKIAADEYKVGSEAARNSRPPERNPVDEEVARRKMDLEERKFQHEREQADRDKAQDDNILDLRERLEELSESLEKASKPKKIIRDEDGLITEIA